MKIIYFVLGLYNAMDTRVAIGLPSDLLKLLLMSF